MHQGIIEVRFHSNFRRFMFIATSRKRHNTSRIRERRQYRDEINEERRLIQKKIRQSVQNQRLERDEQNL